MKTPLLSTSYDDPSDYTQIGSFSLDGLDDDFNGFTGAVVPANTTAAQGQPQFHIVVKRNDGLYKTLNVLNTVFSILAVLLIVVTFIMVFYSLITITEVAEMVSQVKEHNVLVPANK